MKRTSSAYRLQLIKEVASRKQSEIAKPDAMADYIHHLLTERPEIDSKKDDQRNFSGLHFDEHAGGWVSDRWTMK